MVLGSERVKHDADRSIDLRTIELRIIDSEIIDRRDHRPQRSSSEAFRGIELLERGRCCPVGGVDDTDATAASMSRDRSEHATPHWTLAT